MHMAFLRGLKLPQLQVEASLALLTSALLRYVTLHQCLQLIRPVPAADCPLASCSLY
jgi:hypothetical protein